MNDLELNDLIINRSENKNIDFKVSIPILKVEKINIYKDIIAMANTKNGWFLILWIDDNWNPVKIENEIFENFDTTSFNNWLESYITPKFSVTIRKPKYKEFDIIIIEIPEFKEEPIICKKQFNDINKHNKVILKDWAIYIRNDKCESVEINDNYLMRELLWRALSRKKENLLNEISRLISWRPKKQINNVDKYLKEIEESNNFINLNIWEEFDKNWWWSIQLRPIEYNESRIWKGKLKEFLRNSKVSLRWWSFPYINENEISNYKYGIWTFLKSTWWNHIEALNFYGSWFFNWKKNYFEDEWENKVLWYVSTIYSVTEYFLFIKYLYIDELNIDSDIEVKIKLNNLKNRVLKSQDYRIILFRDYISKENSFEFNKTFSPEKIKAWWKEIANDICREIFRIFNYDDVTFGIIEDWQNKLLNKEF